MSLSAQNDSRTKFEVLDISGDVGLRVFGGTEQEIFVNASLGMYHLITDTEALGDGKSISVSAESQTIDGLLVAWLNELIFHFDTYGFVGKRVAVHELSASSPLSPEGREAGAHSFFHIRASVYGEEFDPNRHEAKLLIKAATYHRLKLEKKNDIWQAEIVFDI